MLEKKEKGLTRREAEEKLTKYGRNELVQFRKINPLKIFFSQFTSPLILILLAAALVSGGIAFLPNQNSNINLNSNILDVVLILLIVLVSGISGFIQEYKSEKTIEALQKIVAPKAKVIRDGKAKELPAAEIVPGDLILLDSGDVIPADAKLISTFDLKVDESILTGESEAVGKKSQDEIFMNTFIDAGKAEALVTKTGMATKVGNIAEKLQKIEEEKTLFEKEISSFSQKISLVVLGLTIIILLVSLLKYGLYLSLLTAISLAVAAIPEGLPAVIVLALALGAKVMFQQKALIRKLTVTESIGAIDIICADKTGTLTKNEMTVTKLYFNNKVFDFNNFKNEKEKLKHLDVREELKPFLLCSALCNNTNLVFEGKKNKKYQGSQTEIALRIIAEKLGFIKEKLEKEYQRIYEIAFTSERKMMSVLCRHVSSDYRNQRKNTQWVYSKGAPEVLLEKCRWIYHQGKIISLSEAEKKKIYLQNKEFASHALRVLGFAFKEIKNKRELMPQNKRELKPQQKLQQMEQNLVWLGLQALIDPPRTEVKPALAECKTAGIRVIMLTGDNPLTAQAIAEEIGLKSSKVVEGKHLDRITDKELKTLLNSGVNIFARISPFHKLRLLEVLKKDNRVAMTGDGVNDALALKKADVGIAMSIKGTEVAKEASDMILLDDNFATITAAIKEGRRIFDNIRKFVNYLFTCNLAEVLVLFIATIFLKLPEPLLLSVQLLWINLLTDGLPALALGVDPPRSDIMKEPPRKKNEPIINREIKLLTVSIGIEKTIILFATFFLILPFGLELARTALFTGFVFYEFVRIAVIRRIDRLSWLSNKWLLAALMGSILLQLLIIYTPLNSLFHLVPLTGYAWSILFGGIIIGYFLAMIITNFISKSSVNPVLYSQNSPKIHINT